MTVLINGDDRGRDSVGTYGLVSALEVSLPSSDESLEPKRSHLEVFAGVQ